LPRTATQSTTGSREENLAALALQQPLRRIAGRNRTKADICVYRLEGAEIAVKDYRGRAPWIRHTIGRFLIRREAAAHRAAAAIVGVPEFLGRIGPFALATRWIHARPLAAQAADRVDPAVFDRVGAVLDALHGRGIALGDLHHRDVLVSEDGSVHLVDLATACVLGERPGPMRRAWFRRMRDADRVALARMRARFTGADESEAVAAVGAAAAAWHSRGRTLKAIWDRLRGKKPGGG